MPANDVEITGTFTVNEYKITYNLNGGSLEEGKENPDKYTIETESFTLNNPVKQGYTFAGWTVEDGEIPVKTVQIEKGSTGDREYTANWKIPGEEKLPIIELNDERYLLLSNNMTIEEFKENYKITEASLYDEEETEMFRTGSKLDVTIEGVKTQYTVILKGDIDGNGKVEFWDIVELINIKYKNEGEWTDEKRLAARCDSNIEEREDSEKPEFFDIVRIINYVYKNEKW